MTKYPSVAKRAQYEIDTVIGTDRLPGFADRDSLPYLNALVKEVLRWNSVVPTGKDLCLLERPPPSLTCFLKPFPTVSYRTMYMKVTSYRKDL